MLPLANATSNTLIDGLTGAAGLVGTVWGHAANRHRRARGLVNLLAWQFVKHVLKRPVVIRFHNQRLKCYPDSTSTSAALYFSGYPDYWEMKFLQAYLRPGDNFLDIGANSGVYSILASAYIGSEGHIDAFEPIERTAGRIEEQAALNGLRNLHVHRLAVCDQDAKLEFGYSSSDAMMHVRRPGEHEHSSRHTVQGIRLDAFEPYRTYAIGKMDIEGAEPMALEGASERLRQANPPVWLLELAGYSTFYGVTSGELLRRLAAAGYECAVFDPQLRKLEYTRTPWVLGVQNVLVIAAAHRATVEERLRESLAAVSQSHNA
jgi:FkbM family methyltransferase